MAVLCVQVSNAWSEDLQATLWKQTSESSFARWTKGPAMKGSQRVRSWQNNLTPTHYHWSKTWRDTRHLNSSFYIPRAPAETMFVLMWSDLRIKATLKFINVKFLCIFNAVSTRVFMVFLLTFLSSISGELMSISLGRSGQAGWYGRTSPGVLIHSICPDSPQLTAHQPGLSLSRDESILEWVVASFLNFWLLFIILFIVKQKGGAN